MMPKSDMKQTKTERLDALTLELGRLRTDLDDSNEAIDDLEEAICPRVAARLEKLEQRVKDLEGDVVNLFQGRTLLETTKADAPSVTDSIDVAEPTKRGPDAYIIAQKLYERDLLTAQQHGEKISLDQTWIYLPIAVRNEIVEAAEELIVIVQTS
jgi:nucleotidyltransferase/DNA polymerase involved in DNA repair